MIHRHVTVYQVVMYLGMVVQFEMYDGTMVTGRVVAADEWFVHLIRTDHHKLDLDDIKRIVTPPPA